MAQIGLVLPVFITRGCLVNWKGGVSGWERPGVMKWGCLWTRGGANTEFRDWNPGHRRVEPLVYIYVYKYSQIFSCASSDKVTV